MIMPTPSRRDGGDDSGGCIATALASLLGVAVLVLAVFAVVAHFSA